jgi:RecA/RadA recombinase
MGTYSIMIGDSSSGKTFFSLTTGAEAVRNPAFDKYRIIYDDVEHGALMDLERFFGKKLAARLEPPRIKNGEPAYSETVEEFFYNAHDAMDEGPCIYFLDSMDGLTSLAERKKFKENKAAVRKGNQTKGDFGDGKAIKNSRNIRTIAQRLRATGSILIVISQTRDNIDAGMFGPKKTYAGGKSLKFYAAFEVWLSVGKTLKREVRDKERPVGIISRVHIKKNRLTGKDRTIEIPIYYEMGFDDIGSCVDFLVSEGHWRVKKGVGVTADEFNYSGGRSGLIAKIEDEGLENDLRDLTGEVWNEVEAALAMNRKPRYD